MWKGRPILPDEEKKRKVSITLSKKILNKLEVITNNKSFFIEKILNEYFNKDGNDS